MAAVLVDADITLLDVEAGKATEEEESAAAASAEMTTTGVTWS